MKKPLSLKEVTDALKETGVDANLFAGIIKMIAEQKIQVKKAYTEPLVDPSTGDVVYKEINGKMVPVQKVVYETDSNGKVREVTIVEEQLDPKVAKILLDAMKDLTEQTPKVTKVEIGLTKEDQKQIQEMKKLIEEHPEMVEKMKAIDTDFEEMP